MSRFLDEGELRQPEEGRQIQQQQEIFGSELSLSETQVHIRNRLHELNYIQSTAITSDHVVSITQTNTLLVLHTHYNFNYNLRQELLKI